MHRGYANVDGYRGESHVHGSFVRTNNAIIITTTICDNNN